MDITSKKIRDGFRAVIKPSKLASVFMLYIYTDVKEIKMWETY